MVETYFSDFPEQQLYSTFDWGVQDEDGYYFIMGRSDDVINVAGHRLGTREVEPVHFSTGPVSVIARPPSVRRQVRRAPR